MVLSNKNLKIETDYLEEQEKFACVFLLHTFKIFFKFPTLWLYYFNILNVSTKIFFKKYVRMRRSNL